jgi:hypothetical protein
MRGIPEPDSKDTFESEVQKEKQDAERTATEAGRQIDVRTVQRENADSPI